MQQNSKGHPEQTAPGSTIRALKLIRDDPWLKPYEGFYEDLRRRTYDTELRLTQGTRSLLEFAAGHEYFGLHKIPEGWVFREWAPNATAIYLIGSFSNWKKNPQFLMKQVQTAIWELKLPEPALKHQDLYRLLVEWPGGEGERLPAWGRRVYQDPDSHQFSAQVWQPPKPYRWKVENFELPHDPLLIYEAHVGMAQEESKVGTYLEFRDKILPHVIECGYNAVQIMAIQEHPYYASFGYQVSSFFAPSSRFGTPEDLCSLIDACHEAGIAVFLDLVHSHAVKNEVEGLSRFDGSYYQFFHEGQRGEHPVWDSRLFNYGKNEVLHFLLSNVRYWLDAFHFDGFRFDGVTSMLYYDHGFGDPFVSYDKYFNGRVDMDALVYLCLANKLVDACSNAITIAEDVSGLPGLAMPREAGGAGFDYRLSMGIPDYWIQSLTTKSDDQWHVEHMFQALTDRRRDEKTISYAESHDQALVGDKTIIFRLLDANMYYKMRIDQQDYLIERGMSLHRLIRFITFCTAAYGYLNFMGNEFGHPEWIDFPRPGNNWSFRHARRMWSLMRNPDLQYQRLLQFDRDMIHFGKEQNIFRKHSASRVYSHVDNQVLGFRRSDRYFFFNFSPGHSLQDYEIEMPEEDTYEIIFDTDSPSYGGSGRVERGSRLDTQEKIVDFVTKHFLKIDMPPRSALVLKPMHREKKSKPTIRESRHRVQVGAR